MVIVVSVLVIATMVMLIVVVLQTARRITRWALRTTPAGGMRARPTRAETPPFGGLPTLADPVGPLGNPMPDADLSADASSREIYGE